MSHNEYILLKVYQSDFDPDGLKLPKDRKLKFEFLTNFRNFSILKFDGKVTIHMTQIASLRPGVNHKSRLQY